MNKIKTNKIKLLLILILLPTIVIAQELNSQNYTIKDATIGGNSTTESTNYSLIANVNPLGHSKLESSSYRSNSGSASEFIANIPTITCLETDTDENNTTCTQLPNSLGMIGECGFGGCYDRAKIEINPQGNPIDTLYLVKITNVDTSQVYYLQSDFTISTAYTIDDFMSICTIQGRDNNDSNCNDSGDLNWNSNQQKYNIRGLQPSTNYSVSIAALNGNFTGTDFGPAQSFTTQVPTLGLNVDISPASSPENQNNNPYNISLGNLGYSVFTSENLIWVTMDTNIIQGGSVYVKSANAGLLNSAAATLIPSESEDLSIDPNQNGGYGIKLNSYSSPNQTLGPLILGSTYQTAGANIVGALSTNNTLLASTNNIGNNLGQITNGRFGIEVKAKSIPSYPTGNYSDTIIFTLISNI